jgi:hypothetical protein
MDMVNSKLDEFVGKIAIEEQEDQEDLWWKEREKVKGRNKTIPRRHTWKSERR